MHQDEFLPAFIQLGKIFNAIAQKKEWPGFSCGLSEPEYKELDRLATEVYFYNNWFTEENVRKSFGAIGAMLEEKKLTEWLLRYPPIVGEKKTIAIIMAGNIPMVGFHDLLCVLLSGHRACVKLSSNDNLLLPAVMNVLEELNPELKKRVDFISGKMTRFDAVIATGSNNSSRYFDYYFGRYPHIIRRNRNSVAVITRDTSTEELKNIGEDIFSYFGLGCRNVSKVYLEEGVDLNRLIESVFSYKEVINNNKYANNYDYNRTLYILNKVPFLENGFMIFKEDQTLSSPVGVLFYEYFSSEEELSHRLESQSDLIQCVVGKNYLPFGKSQYPNPWDYADGRDTMQFLRAFDFEKNPLE